MVFSPTFLGNETDILDIELTIVWSWAKARDIIGRNSTFSAIRLVPKAEEEVNRETDVYYISHVYVKVTNITDHIIRTTARII